MKNLKLLFFVALFYICAIGNAQTPAPKGTYYPNATKSDTLSSNTRVPVFNENNILNKYVSIDSLSNYIVSEVGETVVVENEYANMTTMYADQASQTDSFIQYVEDASAHPNITSGSAYFEYLGTTNGNNTDYRVLSESEYGYVTLSGNQTITGRKIFQSTGTGYAALFQTLGLGSALLASTNGFGSAAFLQSTSAAQSLRLQSTGVGKLLTFENESVQTGYVDKNANIKANSINIGGNGNNVMLDNGSVTPLSSLLTTPATVSEINTGTNNTKMVTPLGLAGSDYFTKTQNDTYYKPIGYVPAWAEITGKPTLLSQFTNDVPFSTGAHSTEFSETLQYTGTRAGGDLVTTIGDYDGDGSNATSINLKANGFNFISPDMDFRIVDETVHIISGLNETILSLHGSGFSNTNSASGQTKVNFNLPTIGNTNILSFPNSSGTLSTQEWVTAQGYSTGSASVSDTAYGAGWNGQTTTAPSQNAVYDVISGIVASATGSEQSEKFTAVGGETTWTLSNTPIAGYKRSIFISGIKQEEGVDYSISGNTVTWLGINNPLAAGDRVSIEYNDLTAPSAINDTDDVPEGSTNLYADANATNQGNTFNGANQLVKLDGTGKLPAIDGSALTNIPISGDAFLATSQTFTGTKTFDTGNSNNNIISNNNTSGEGILINNYNSGIGMYSLNTNNGVGIFSRNESSGTGINSTNTSTGNGISVNNTSSGRGYVVFNSSTGKGFEVVNSSTGLGLYLRNTSSGNGIMIDGEISATGYNFVSRNNTTTTYTLDKLGNVIGNTFNGVALTTSGSSTNFLNEQGNYVSISGGGGDMLLGTAQTVTAKKTFNTGTIGFRNPANTFSYNLLGSAITADRTLTLPLLTGTDTFAVLALAQTFTNKTLTSPVINTQISGTVTNGGNITTTNYLVGATATQTLTNKTLTSPILTTPDLGTPSALVATNATGTASGLTAGNSTQTNALKSATTTINVSSATAPTNGQVLTATSSTTATWQTPTAGSAEYLEYVSTLYQSGTSAPVETVIKNTLGVTVSYTRTGSGEYTATASSGIFTSGKTTIICQAGENASGISLPLVTRSSSTVIRIAVTNGASYADDTLRNNAFIIRVYP